MEFRHTTDIKRVICHILTYLLFVPGTSVWAQDTLIVKGQVAAWAHYNEQAKLPVWVGGRYIPTLNYQIKLSGNQQIDFEGAANLYASAGLQLFDSTYTTGKIKPYRAWMRYSNNQLEVRLGLQKINFGSANMLRPLMWFDQLDPRDPLQLTDGVWGLLGRYYFLNNANLWVWGLYGNNQQKMWETGNTYSGFPELGGRFQSPVPRGELAFTYHYRKADLSEQSLLSNQSTSVGENRVGVDGKWDLGVGLWFEAVWMGKTRQVGLYTNEQIINVGTDYTFGLGNGLNVVYEQLLVSYSQQAFEWDQRAWFSCASVSYPLGISDQLGAIFYYDWTNNCTYRFINYKRQLNLVQFFIMAYWNPDTYRLPQQGEGGYLFSGKGIQLMLVYNH